MKKLALASTILVMTGVLAIAAPEAHAKGKKAKSQETTSSLTCTAGSVTANPLAGGSSVAFSECLGPISGNDVTSSIDDDLTSFLDTHLGDWTLDAKYEDGHASAGPDNFGFSWTETSEGEGSWSVDTAITGPFVISLKAGNRYNSYYVDGIDSTMGGTWATFDEKALSHASLFVARNYEPETKVPEPTTTVALALVGLTAVGIKKKLA